MNYREAMASKDAEAWTEEVGNEKKRFDKFNAFTAVPKNKVPKGSKILTTTWACKKNPAENNPPYLQAGNKSTHRRLGYDTESKSAWPYSLWSQE